MNTNTSALFEQAIDKLRDEMAANAKDENIEHIGEFMTALLRNRPEYAGEILKDKTIKGAYKAMEAVAKAEKKRSMGPYEGFGIVLKYYGLPDMTKRQIWDLVLFETEREEPERAAKPEPTRHADEFDLDALLDELG